MTEALKNILSSDAIGLLGREIAVELFNISRSGCLLESRSAIPAGAVGTLSVEIDGTSYTDNVRVARCQALPGSGDRHHVGVEFLPLIRPGVGSLRRYAASLRQGGPDGPMSVRFEPIL